VARVEDEILSNFAKINFYIFTKMRSLMKSLASGAKYNLFEKMQNKKSTTSGLLFWITGALKVCVKVSRIF